MWRSSLDLSLLAHHRVIIDTSNLLGDGDEGVARLDLVAADEVRAVLDVGRRGVARQERAVVEEVAGIDDRRLRLARRSSTSAGSWNGAKLVSPP